MLDKLLQFFRGSATSLDGAFATHPGADTLRDAVAILLVRMAKVDGSYSQSEVRSVFSLLKKHLQLSDEETLNLISVAENTAKLSDSVKAFTAALRAQLSKGERKKILEMIVEIIEADGTEDLFEKSYLNSVIVDLGLSPEDLNRQAQ